jgi:hypothetical protein
MSALPQLDQVHETSTTERPSNRPAAAAAAASADARAARPPLSPTAFQQPTDATNSTSGSPFGIISVRDTTHVVPSTAAAGSIQHLDSSPASPNAPRNPAQNRTGTAAPSDATDPTADLAGGRRVDAGSASNRALVEITLPLHHRNSRSDSLLAGSLASRRRSSDHNNSLLRNGSIHSTVTEPAMRRTHTNTPTRVVQFAANGALALGAELQRRNEEQARRAAEAEAEALRQQQQQQPHRAIDSAGRNVYIAGLPPACDEAVLRAVFEEFGDVESIRITVPTHAGHNGGRPYGFVLMSSREAAEVAIRELHGRLFDGHRLQVRLASRGPASGTPAANPSAPAAAPQPAPQRQAPPHAHLVAGTGRPTSAPQRQAPHYQPQTTQGHPQHHAHPARHTGAGPAAQAAAAFATGYAAAAPDGLNNGRELHGGSAAPPSPAGPQYVYLPINLAHVVGPSGGSPTPSAAQHTRATSSATNPSPTSVTASVNGGAAELNQLFAQRSELWARVQQIDAQIQRALLSQAQHLQHALHHAAAASGVAIDTVSTYRSSAGRSAPAALLAPAGPYAYLYAPPFVPVPSRTSSPQGGARQ